MNDFDRFLEFKLRQMLDPVVTLVAPRRSRRAKGSPVLTIVSPPLDPILATEPAQPALVHP
jgi:hypothetical protein